MEWHQFEHTLIPIPSRIAGTDTPVRTWRASDWERMQTEDTVIYRKKILLSAQECRSYLILRMERIGCLAEVYADGRKICSHYGAFTDWETPLETYGKDSTELEIRLKKAPMDLSPMEQDDQFGTVSLIALPHSYISGFLAETDYDGDGILRLHTWIHSSDPVKSRELHIILEKEDGTPVLSSVQEVTDTEEEYIFSGTFPKIRPWSTDSPVLYSLRLVLYENGAFSEETGARIGFRSLRREGTQVLWNHTPLKLRGLCYRQPLEADTQLLRHDLTLYKEAGVNYLRSLFYPFDRRMLDLCDEMGFLTEQSASVYQVGRGIRPTQDLPDCREKYAGQFSEIVKLSRNHVSTLLFCTGTESIWGYNMRLCAQMARELAPSQLLNFSYPMTVPSADIQPDVWSVLYADWKQPLDIMYDHMEIGHANGCANEIGYVTGAARRSPLPVLHEIYAPLPYCDREEILRDGGIHEFWGESILRFQEKIEQTSGTLGGSVLGGYDENGEFSMLLAECRWGILDENHEPKPEYWHLKMAFTGCRPLDYSDSTSGYFPSGSDDSVSSDGFSLDEYEDRLIFHNSLLEIHLSKKTGLLDGVWRKGEKLITSGPFLQLTGLVCQSWRSDGYRAEKTASGGIMLTLEGGIPEVCDAVFHLLFTPDGQMETTWSLTQLYRHNPPEVKAQIGVSPGGLNEYGISYVLPSSMNLLSWTRKGLWESYPENHPGRSRGTAQSENRKDFESMKHHIFSASVTGKNSCLLIDGEGTYSIRMQQEAVPPLVTDDRNPEVRFSGSWYRMDDTAGCWNGTETLSRTAGDTAEFTFEGTGVRLYGSVDRICGLYQVLIDDRIFCLEGSSYPLPLDQSADSRGFEKMYRMCLAEIHGLEPGLHTVCLKVLGKKADRGNDTWVSLDYIETETDNAGVQYRMILNRDFNYPRLVRGNYMRDPVRAKAGNTYQVRMLLTDQEDRPLC
ncbi:MAG TPA: hypothetical protein H9955_16835 [Candidatus Mediterraneibacter cottocaccae]|nr:hypothetical protein [Candidatus Mediterraneibacter cottocaccae]